MALDTFLLLHSRSLSGATLSHNHIPFHTLMIPSFRTTILELSFLSVRLVEPMASHFHLDASKALQLHVQN